MRGPTGPEILVFIEMTVSILRRVSFHQNGTRPLAEFHFDPNVTSHKAGVMFARGSEA